MSNELSLAKSMELLERSKNVVPSSAQTFSKNYRQFSFGKSPVFLAKGKGAYVWDVDGNRFLDLPAALGPVILGHADPDVNAKVREQMENGIAFSLPHFKEVELAEKLREIIPQAEMTRFGKNGSDATSGAVRAARAFTGREIIACCGYHGWQDWFIGTTLRNQGVPKAVRDLTIPFQFNKIESLEKIFAENPGKVACVIIEPMGFDLPQPGFLKSVKELAHKNGALLIYDECWTGFRLDMGGVAKWSGVEPDISCFGKAMGNGFPIAAVCGRREVMEVFDKIFFSFTFGGDMMGISASLATIEKLESNKVLSHIWGLGEKLLAALQSIIAKNDMQKHIKMGGIAPRTLVNFYSNDGQEWYLLKSYFQQEMHKRGFLFGGSNVINFSYNESELNALVAAYEEITALAKKHIDDDSIEKALSGGIVEPVFRKN